MKFNTLIINTHLFKKQKNERRERVHTLPIVKKTKDLCDEKELQIITMWWRIVVSWKRRFKSTKEKDTINRRQMTKTYKMLQRNTPIMQSQQKSCYNKHQFCYNGTSYKGTVQGMFCT
jgi:hypothetical protein